MAEWRGLRGPVLVLNDGWPDRNQFARIVAEAPNALAVSKMRDEGFCSHQLRDWAMDWADTEWVFMHDLDIALEPEFVDAFNAFDPTTAPRWMFRLTRPVEGYQPFASDRQGRTKRDVHPNVHLLPRDMARYDPELYGRHIGDEQFFDKLSPDYKVFPVPVRMESR